MTTAELPTDVAALQALLCEQHAELQALRRELDDRESQLERLKLELARLKRLQFGRSSEKLSAQIAQLELAIDELEAQEARAVAPPKVKGSKTPEAPPPVRQALPDHLPREAVTHEPACACPGCGGALEDLGEDVSEVLEYVPAAFKVIRHVRPKRRCRTCDTIVQQPAASRPIARGLPGPGLISQVLVAKYADHLPLYRQAEIYAREGVTLPRSTLADWVKSAAGLLAPLGDALARHVIGGSTVHGDDTPVPVLAPGNGKTRTARLWTYVRDERPASGEAPPAVLFRYSPNRQGQHPQRHLKDFRGVLHADGFAGFNALYEKGQIQEAACWAHVRRKFHDIAQANGTPLAQQALARIADLYALEAEIRGQSADIRHRERQARAGPLLDALKDWLTGTLTQVSTKSVFAGVVRYALKRWEALTRYRDNGAVEIDNNAAERALRTVALGRKNYLFAGSDRGGESAALIYSLIGTAKLNGQDPYAYLRAVLERIADHPINDIEALLPWHLSLVESSTD